MKKFLLIVSLMMTAILPIASQIDVSGYSLVYSSETPERAASLLSLTREELANCTGDFTSTANMERHWNYCTKATSDWNKRMATTAEERALVNKVANGQLRLLALTTNGTANGFITGGIRMKLGYKYGIIEVKAKCNPHASNFPAIWMMPTDQKDGWPNCGEIDIMEQVGASGTVWSTVHLGARYDKPVGKSYSYSGSRAFGSGYHIYSLLWTKNSLIFYCDGIQVFRYDKDHTLDIETNPDFEKWQFPYNKEFELILNQSLGKNAWWGSENPDPGYTYEMDVEYVRIWQAPETYEIDQYVVLRNYTDPTCFMAVTDDNKLATTVLDSKYHATANSIFGLIRTDSGGKYFLQSLSGKRIGYTADANKQVVLSEAGEAYYMIRNSEKGVAFDYAKNTAPFNYSEGSRALSLYAKRDNVVVTSGTSKDASWWLLEDAQDVVSHINLNKGVNDMGSEYGQVHKVVRNGKIIIVSGGREYSVVGQQIKK